MRNPTWSDYGTHEDSRHPELWEGVVFAFAPCLGPTGLKPFDLSRLQNHGTMSSITPATHWQVHRGRYCLNLDGAGRYLTFPDRVPLRPTAITVSCWINPNATGQIGKWAISKWHTAGNQRGYGIWYDADTFKFSVSDDGLFDANTTAISATTPAAGTWYHVCGVYATGGNARLYLNGKLDATSASTATTLVASTAALEIAANVGGSNNINARLDDFLIYNRALSEDEIRKLSMYRGVAYEARPRIRYSYSSNEYTASPGLSPGFRLSQALSTSLSDSLSIG